MARDPYMLLSIELALVGIVLVVGFFFVWRSMSRLEARIDELSAVPPGCPMVSGMCTPPGLSRGAGSPTSNAERVADNCRSESEKGENRYGYNGRDDLDYDGNFDECDDDDGDDDGDDGDFSIMKACFGDIPFQSMIDDAKSAFMIFNADSIASKQKEGVVLEEIAEEGAHAAKDAEKHDKAVDEQNDDEGSVAETEANELSKSKLKKMHVDALRSLCASRGLPTDGLKSALVERILSSLPSTAA